MKTSGKKISRISAMHFIKLAVRLAIFSAVLAVYIVLHGWKNEESIFGEKVADWAILGSLFALYALEMILRFFPSKIESMGCQKQFKRNFRETENTAPKRQSWKRTFAVAAAWVALNAVFVTLYFTGIIDRGILILIGLAYSVCDMVCILFFCPFHVWFMKNKCCGTCRIYNWDFAMMFTPFAFVLNVFTMGLAALSLALLIQWEVLYHKHPERFCENTNQSLSCANCAEKLCRHKKHIRKFIKRIAGDRRESADEEV